MALPLGQSRHPLLPASSVQRQQTPLCFIMWPAALMLDPVWAPCTRLLTNTPCARPHHRAARALNAPPLIIPRRLVVCRQLQR